MNNPHFEEEQKKAAEYLHKPNKIRVLVEQAMEKLKKWDIAPVSALAEQVKILARMLEAYSRGQYKLSWKTATSLIAALLYFVTPTDMIPDFIVGLGYLDDLSVLRFALKSIESDLERFTAWERLNIEKTSV